MTTTLDVLRRDVTPHLTVSGDLRPSLSRADQRFSRIMGVAVEVAEQQRKEGIVAAVGAMMLALRELPGARAEFVRRVLVAVSNEPPARPWQEAALRAAEADASENLAAMQAAMDGMTADERRAWVRRLEAEIGAKQELLRSLTEAR